MVGLLTWSALARSEEMAGTGWLVRTSSPLPVMFRADSPVQPIHAEQDVYLVTDPAMLELLQEEGLITWAEPDREVTLFTEPDAEETEEASLWHLDLLDLDGAEQLGCCGQEIWVGVIDSGVNAHRELVHALLPGYDFLHETEDVTDNIGHGTFVSGLIAAAEDGSGITGAAPEAKIVPLKAFDEGETTRVSDICKAIYSAVDTYGCRVLNMSFGVKTNSTALATAITYAQDRNVICVASVGNLGNGTLYYPAALAGVIGVGAVDEDSAIASFSQRNESVFVMAPGKAVTSTAADGDYTVKSGTSFSAPLVTGVVARLLCADESLTGQQVQHLLAASAVDLGEPGYDVLYGYGRVCVTDAMTLLLADTPYFISPFLIRDGQYQVTVLNNTEEVLQAQCLFTQYRNEIMEDLAWQDLLLEPGTTAVAVCPWKEHTIKAFLWPNYTDLTPLARDRECEVPS